MVKKFRMWLKKVPLYLVLLLMIKSHLSLKLNWIENILTSALGIDEFFRVSNSKSVKEMWDTLLTTHERTEEVKMFRLKPIFLKYEMFRMLTGEKILDLPKIFSHLENHLIDLGKFLLLMIWI